MSGLRLERVVKHWGATEVLRGADLTLRPGTRGFLGGKNGAGKTTLLRIAAGLIEAAAGATTLHGYHPVEDRRAYQAALGYLPAGNGGLYARLTAAQNLDFRASQAFLNRAKRDDAVARELARFEIEDLAARRVDRLSMGQRQRVRLACVFLHSPSVVLLDEPLTSLDEDAVHLLDDALAAHRAAGGASLCCAPSADDALSAPDAVWRIEDGLVRAA